MKRSVRVCLVGSAGGHASALMKLQTYGEDLGCFSVTTSKVVEKHLVRYAPVYIVNNSNRRHPIQLLRTMIGCPRVLLGGLIRPSVDLILTQRLDMAPCHEGVDSAGYIT